MNKKTKISDGLSRIEGFLVSGPGNRVKRSTGRGHEDQGAVLRVEDSGSPVNARSLL